MAHLEELEGIVLYHRNHRERDFLVKIFTKKYGKLMFFIRGSKKQQGSIIQSIQPFTKGTFIADVREEGLSFLRSTKDVQSFREIQTDIFKHAYSTYICSLADAAIEDHLPHMRMFDEINQALNLIAEGFSSEVVTNIIEVKFLTDFGVAPNLTSCAICGKTQGIFDYSDRYHGILCSEHFLKDNRRLHVDPKAMQLIRLYSVIKLDKIGEVSIKEQTQLEIRRLIDHIYNQLVGLNLKSKKFIDNLYKWEDTFKNDLKK